jgi:hypothetical protein
MTLVSPDDSGKRALLESAGKNVRVNVKNRLPGSRARIEDQTVLAVCVLEREIARNRNHVSKQRGVTRREFTHIRVRLGLWNHEQVHRSLWGDVANRYEVIILEHHVGRNLTIDDARED